MLRIPLDRAVLIRSLRALVDGTSIRFDENDINTFIDHKIFFHLKNMKRANTHSNLSFISGETMGRWADYFADWCHDRDKERRGRPYPKGLTGVPRKNGRA